MMARTECCETCRWFHRRLERDKWGECRIHAPHKAVDQSCPTEATDYETVFPLISDDDWCGEWTACGEQAIRYVDKHLTR